jgi:hypothetical protein
LVSETLAGGGHGRAADGVILVVISVLAAALVIAGLSYAAGASGRHKAALAAAGCEPNLSPSGLQCTTMQTLTSRYMAIATPAIQQMNTGAAAYRGNERHHLAAAEAALTAEVTSENEFDTSLARFPFPPAIVPVARALIQASHARARLIAEQARSSTLPQLRSFNDRVKAASVAVKAEIRLIRTDLDVRPTADQEP